MQDRTALKSHITQITRREYFTNLFRHASAASEDKLISEQREINGNTTHLIEFKEARLSLKQPIQHAVDHAKAIAKLANKNNLPIKLFLSGGIDSEAMAEAFLHAKVKFEVVIGRYNGDMNYFDYKDAVTFCENHNLKIEFIDIDVFNFLESGGALKYAKELGCRSPQLAVHLHLLDQVSGYCVLAGNPIFPVFRNSSDDLITELQNGKLSIHDVWGAPNQTQSVYLRFLEKRGRLGQPFFFQSSPELCMSFLFLDEIVSLMAAGIKTHDYQMKCQMYKLGGFLALPRKDKYTGFEKYRADYDKKMQTAHGIGFDLCFRKPLEKMNPNFPLKVSFILPAQIKNKLIQNITLINKRNTGPCLASIDDLKLKASRRKIFSNLGALSAGFFTILLFSRFAKAASCYCCSNGIAEGPFGIASAPQCIKRCIQNGYDGMEISIGGGACEAY